LVYRILFLVASPGFDFIFSVLAKRLTGKNISRMCQVGR